MRRAIMRSMAFLSQKSEPAGPRDANVARDLRDTLAAHADECVGMAANMIGVGKRVIVFDDGGRIGTMFNPEIIDRSDPFATEEGCLSLDGTRPTTRYRTITVRYQDDGFATRTGTYHGWTAQIIQHELDHCNGILI